MHFSIAYLILFRMRTLLEIAILAGLNLFLFGYVQRKMALHLLVMHQQLAARNGKVLGTEFQGDTQILRASAPLSRMFGYATDLRSITQGRGSFTMMFDRYDLVKKGQSA